MTVWDWLQTTEGVQLEHAIIVLLLAIAGYLTYLTRQETRKNRDLLNGHLELHASTRSMPADPSEPKILT